MSKKSEAAKNAASAVEQLTNSGIASKIKNDFKGLGGSVNELGGNMKNAFGKLADVKGGKFVDVMKSTGSKMVTIAGQPVRWAIKGAKMPVNAANWFTKKAPVPAAIAVVAAGAWGVGSLWKHHQAKKTERAAMDEMAQAQAYAYAQAAPQQVSYQNSVSADEYQQLMNQMKGNGTPVAGHADTVAASRQQGTAVAPSL